MNIYPTATYRIQFNPNFTFAHATSILQYLKSLNISHIYASPYLQAGKNSTHGYDVVDPTLVSKEVGGSKKFKKFIAHLKKLGLSQIIDIVPNHMGTNCPENIWFMDVLKYGLASPFANYFDIYWENYPKIHLPILAHTPEEEIKSQKIKLVFSGGTFFLQYYTQTFPLTPKSLLILLTKIIQNIKSPALVRITKKLHDLENNDLARLKLWESELQIFWQRAKKHVAAIKKVLSIFNDQPALLNNLLNQQHYKLVSWQKSKTINTYRRFFHLNTFIGLRIEEPKVFDAIHNLPKKWVKTKSFTGIRVDHIDGLRNPLQYLKRLAKSFTHTWIIVEKILAATEQLPKEWPIAGTTGYDFLNLTNQIFLDTQNAEVFTNFYAKFTEEPKEYAKVLYAKKMLVLRELFSCDINYLASLAVKIAPKYFTVTPLIHKKIRTVIIKIMANFPVYRTYIEPEKKLISNHDRTLINKVIKQTKKVTPKTSLKLLNFIKNLLLLKYTGNLETEFVRRFQQLTGSVMAKGAEDTAFYCYNRFVSLNEVGGDPACFGISLKQFHQKLIFAHKYWPHSMLTTSTHDTKRGEDVRSRLALLSEIPETWFAEVKNWTMHNENHYADCVPDRNTQYFLYQNLVGAWPISKERFFPFMEKATREAKVHTDWTTPNINFENKLRMFLEKIFSDQDFIAALTNFVNKLTLPGQINSLAMLTLKLTAPGIPDIYQGSELWDFNLVDPDNRRSVDFKLRQELLQKMLKLSVAEIMQRMPAGLPKLWTIYKILELRKKHPELFLDTAYIPVRLQGAKAQHGIAYLLGEKIFVCVPRLIFSSQHKWDNAFLKIPKGKWQNILTEEKLDGGKLRVAELWQNFPITVLVQGD